MDNVAKDLSDGTALIELAQHLTHKKIEQNWYPKPKSNIEKTQNCDLAINLFTKDGVKLVGISGKDISDNNEKLILGLIWTLISRYSIQQEDKITKDKNNNKKLNLSQKKKSFLLDWAQNKICNCSNIHDFKPYDLVICALLNSYCPNKIKIEKLKSENHFENLNNAIDLMKQLKIPVLIYPEDLKKCNYEVDEKTLMTQLSLIKNSIDNLNDEKESESSSNSFDLSLQESQKEIQENQSNISVNDDEIADDEGSIVESKEELKSNEEIKASALIKNDAYNQTDDSKVRIKIKKSNFHNSHKKVKILIKNSKGEIIGQTYKANVSKVHIKINQNKQENEKIKQLLEEERIRIQKEDEEIKQIENEKDMEYEELNQLKREECEEEKTLESIEVNNSIINESEEEKLKELKKVQKAKYEEIETNSDSELKKVSKLKLDEIAEEADNEINEVKEAKKESINQNKNEGKKFGLVITLKGSDYNNGERVEENQNKDGQEVRLALTLVHCDKTYLNSAGLKLDLAEENIKNNTNQQFVFGKGDNYTIIESETKQGMVWDVADADETNPPSGTPFYLFPFHGRHNQRFIYKNEMIYALQNNQVVTYVGGYTPLVMMPPRDDLKSRQTFHVNLL